MSYNNRNKTTKKEKLSETRMKIKEMVEKFAYEEDEIEILNKRTKKIEKIKGPRQIIVMEVLYQKAKTGNIPAIKEWNNRILGIPVQRIEHSGQIDTGETISSPALSAAIETYVEELKKEYGIQKHRPKSRKSDTSDDKS